MTTEVRKMLETVSPDWVRANFDALKRGGHVLAGTPRMGGDLILLKPVDADGTCFEAVNVGRICEEPTTDDGVLFGIATELFPTEPTGNNGSSEVRRKKIHVQLADGIAANRSRR